MFSCGKRRQQGERIIPRMLCDLHAYTESNFSWVQRKAAQVVVVFTFTGYMTFNCAFAYEEADYLDL